MAYTPKVGLPVKHDTNDAEWISAQLMKLNKEDRATASRGYSANFVAAYRAESIEHKKSNKARYQANTSLRSYVEQMLNWYTSQQAPVAAAKVVDNFEW